MKLIVLIIAFFVPVVCYAGFIDGYQLKSLMEAEQISVESRDRRQAYEAPIYLGYVIGVIDAIAQKTVCPPQSFTIGQATEIVAKYLKANPELWHLSASTLIENSLSSLFPCPRK